MGLDGTLWATNPHVGPMLEIHYYETPQQLQDVLFQSALLFPDPPHGSRPLTLHPGPPLGWGLATWCKDPAAARERETLHEASHVPSGSGR